jgi:hypothetical protein
MNPWYRSKYWFLAIVLVLFIWWARNSWLAAASLQQAAQQAEQQAAHPTPQRTAEAVAEATPTPTPTFQPVVGNLIANPTFSYKGAGWIAYHSAKPMPFAFSSRNGGEAVFSFNKVTSTVQEIFQFLPTGLGGPLVVRGEIEIRGAALPLDAAVDVMAIDTDSKARTLYQVGVGNGTGLFPFEVSYTPHGAAKQLVIAVIAGSTSNHLTTVAVRNLSLVRLQKK